MSWHWRKMYYNLFSSLYELKRANIEELQQIKGIGQVKAIEMKANTRARETSV